MKPRQTKIAENSTVRVGCVKSRESVEGSENMTAKPSEAEASWLAAGVSTTPSQAMIVAQLKRATERLIQADDILISWRPSSDG